MQTILYKDFGTAIRFWKAELNKNSVSLTWGLAGKVMGQRNSYFNFPEEANNYLLRAMKRMQARYTHHPATTPLLLGIKLPRELRQSKMMDKKLLKYIFPLYCDVEDILSLNANGNMGKLQILQGVFWMPLRVIDKEFLLQEIDSLVSNTIYKKKLVVVEASTVVSQPLS